MTIATQSNMANCYDNFTNKTPTNYYDNVSNKTPINVSSNVWFNMHDFAWTMLFADLGYSAFLSAATLPRE